MTVGVQKDETFFKHTRQALEMGWYQNHHIEKAVEHCQKVTLNMEATHDEIGLEW